PFEDDSFDFVYDTCLCYLPEEDLDIAISELFRVVRKGVFFGGITSDMTKEVIERHELFRGVQTLMSTWEWSERFKKHGFRMAIHDRKVLIRPGESNVRPMKATIPGTPTCKGCGGASSPSLQHRHMNRSKAPAVQAPRPAHTGEFVSHDFRVKNMPPT